jgi:hypothetical protein
MLQGIRTIFSIKDINSNSVKCRKRLTCNNSSTSAYPNCLLISIIEHIGEATQLEP